MVLILKSTPIVVMKLGSNSSPANLFKIQVLPTEELPINKTLKIWSVLPLPLRVDIFGKIENSYRRKFQLICTWTRAPKWVMRLWWPQCARQDIRFSYQVSHSFMFMKNDVSIMYGKNHNGSVFFRRKTSDTFWPDFSDFTNITDNYEFSDDIYRDLLLQWTLPKLCSSIS